MLARTAGRERAGSGRDSDGAGAGGGKSGAGGLATPVAPAGGYRVVMTGLVSIALLLALVLAAKTLSLSSDSTGAQGAAKADAKVQEQQQQQPKPAIPPLPQLSHHEAGNETLGGVPRTAEDRNASTSSSSAAAAAVSSLPSHPQPQTALAPPLPPPPPPPHVDPPAEPKLHPPGSALSPLLVCSREADDRYENFRGDPVNVKWCQDAHAKHKVVPGHNWGSMSNKNEQKRWMRTGCDGVVARTEALSCDEMWGARLLEQWAGTLVEALSCTDTSCAPAIKDGGSRIHCFRSFKGSQFCYLENVLVDGSKIKSSGETRTFEGGFVRARATVQRTAPFIKGLQVGPNADNQACDVHVEEPTIFMAHDDIFNLGHHYDDVLHAFALPLLMGERHEDTVFFNMDALRAGGPAGPARIMVPNDRDARSPFFLHYDRMYKAVQKGERHMDKRKFCFKKVAFQAQPGPALFWQDWGHENECSTVGGSPVYQMFSLKWRQRWGMVYKSAAALGGLPGAATMAFDDTDVLQILLIVRAASTGARGRVRVIRNQGAVEDTLRSFPNTRLVVQDMAKLSFEEQVLLAHNSSLIVGVHGAGIGHAIHMPVGLQTKPCCGVVEFIPDGFGTHGNFVRHAGISYSHWNLPKTAQMADGINLDTDKLKSMVSDMITRMRETPSCIHHSATSILSEDQLSPIQQHQQHRRHLLHLRHRGRRRG